MSIRFHKGPSIITLFHDPTSSTSKQILNLLSSYNSRLSNPHHPSPSTSPSNGESCIIEANGAGAGEYLRQAASDPPRTSSNAIQLEIVDRKSNPPTPDQLRSIIDYLASTTTTTGTTGESKPEYTSTGFNLKEHERRKKALKPHLDQNEGKGGMPKIKDGPIIVNWDQGTAATSLEGVKEMLAKMEEEARKEADITAKEKDGGGCVIC